MEGSAVVANARETVEAYNEADWDGWREQIGALGSEESMVAGA
jgi:hypothetical protein